MPTAPGERQLRAVIAIHELLNGPRTTLANFQLGDLVATLSELTKHFSYPVERAPHFR